MINRVDKKFEDLKAIKKKAFISFVTAGDPDLKITKDLVLELERSGTDIVELGVPFSDPLADGPTIQASSLRSLNNGTTLKKILALVGEIRKESEIPLCLMTYYNPVFFYGIDAFVKDAAKLGVDGLVIPDLPPEEGAELIKCAKDNNVATIFFLSPTTSNERIKFVAGKSTGFIYYVSLTGVTGTRESVSAEVNANLKKIKKFTDKPICVGFGVSNKEQVKTLSAQADGVIVGSAIVNKILENNGNVNLVKNVGTFVKSISNVL